MKIPLNNQCPGVTPPLWLALVLAIWTGCAPQHTVIPPRQNEPTQTAAGAPVLANVNPESVRSDCIAGRRLICGRVLKVLPDGLIVESGYTDLLRPPLTQSWVIPGAASAHRNPAALELNQPGTPCFGLVFLTDLPKRRKVRAYDYVILMGYPAGTYAYGPLPNVTKSIRKFSAGLESAVRLTLQAGANRPLLRSAESK